ncbi:LETM1 domain-containing protein 1-like [Gigantopelta aegis]|uniref:LETM1 domain-containing protein 1-like n=1 Tax=Gigantopelta aegis TaxID=1735272 RepID=UPI001B889E29|nr:LETM1 domain-containing protein 1-like [Gigantopelta aegis]
MAAPSVFRRMVLHNTNRTICYKIRINYIYRFSSSHTNEGHVAPPNVLKRYLLDHVTKFVDRRTVVLEEQYPRVFHIYRTFRTGFSSFVKDAKDYYQISSELWNGRAFSYFSRTELEIYRQFPKDIRHFLPILLITLIPGGSFIFPLAYYFPKYLLSHHFWTDKQKMDFEQENLKCRLRHYPSVLQSLRSHTRHVKDVVLREKIVRLVSKIEHGVQPTVEEILAVKPLFCSSPYHLQRMPVTYLRRLGKTQGMSQRRKRLMQDAMLLLNTDQAMLKEGISNMDDAALHKVCFWRGLNPVGLQRQEQIDFLQQWTRISQQTDDESMSLLLHCGVFYSSPCSLSNPFVMVHFNKTAIPFTEMWKKTLLEYHY